jgi:hypothetical protein
MVCALLLGLFWMHGAPSAAEGCHGATAAATLPISHHHPLAAAAMTSPHPPDAGPEISRRTTAGALVRVDGDTCVSTPALRGVELPAVLLLAVLIPGLYGPGAARAGRRGRARRRGPPGCGRELLLRVCVART